MSHRILVADDDRACREWLQTLLSTWGYDVDEAADGAEALARTAARPPDVVVTDLMMPRLNGLELLETLRTEAPFTPLILLTAHGSIDTAVTAMKRGAYDYLTKPVDTPRLRVLIEQALDRRQPGRRAAGPRHGRLLGTSPPMQEVFRLIALAAPTQVPVLILGESGTGKELVARTIHEGSARSTGPFVPVNCAAIPETLLESEILGHERGAYTGAMERRAGCFESAHGGTIFLDEIVEMMPSAQAKFLRVLQDGVVRRIGGRTDMRVDARVLAATNHDMASALATARFRQDLYYRLNVVTITLPPLRERRQDIPLLVEAFLEEFGNRYGKRVRTLDDGGRRALMSRPWPGNVRELRNTIEWAVIGCDGEVLTAAHLPAEAARPPEPDARGPDAPVPFGVPLRELEREAILRTLVTVDNNKTRAASILGISLKTLHNKLRRYRD